MSHNDFSLVEDPYIHYGLNNDIETDYVELIK